MATRTASTVPGEAGHPSPLLRGFKGVAPLASATVFNGRCPACCHGVNDVAA